MARKLDSSRKQTFSFLSPDAASVMLVGDFTAWQQNPIPLKKGKNGVWTTKVELPAGKYVYRFIVDNEWCDDPQCALRVPNPFGSEDMVRQVV